MRKTSVLVDIDETLAQTRQGILTLLNRHAAEPISMVDLIALEQRWESPQGRWAKTIIDREHDLFKLEPYPSASHALATLAEHFVDVQIVTARDQTSEAVTLRWLEHHQLLDHVSHVHFRQTRMLAPTYKAGVALTVGAAAAFDDMGDVATAIAGTGTWTYLIDHPWNKLHKLQSNMRRLESFSVAADHFLVNRGQQPAALLAVSEANAMEGVNP